MALGGVLPRFILGHGAQKRIRAAVIQVLRRRPTLAQVGEKQAIGFEPVGAILHRPLESFFSNTTDPKASRYVFTSCLEK